MVIPVSEASEEQWEEAKQVADTLPRWSDKQWKHISAILGYQLAEDAKGKAA